MFHFNSLALIGQLGRLSRYAFIKTLCIISLTVALYFSATSLQAASNTGLTEGPTGLSLACDDQVNISIPNGTLTVTPSMVAELIPNTISSEYTISITQNGVSMGDQITCDVSGQLVEYNLTYNPTGLSCSGSILVEDKTAPTIICTDINIPCSADSSEGSLGSPSISDNCDDNPSLIHHDNLIDYNCLNVDFLSTIERTWIATDNMGNSNSCVQNINIIRPDISNLIFPDDVTIGCISGNTTPANTGGPSVSNMLSGTSCNFIVYFEDTVTPICSGTTKIVRRWFVTDWCTGDEETDTQIIVIEDVNGPDFTCPSDLVFSANESSCNATVTLPIVSATDDCGNVVSVIPSWQFGSGNITYENVPFGEYNIVYTAEDDCGNTSTCTSSISIIDDVIPVAICDLTTTVGIGEDQSSMICADDLDSGSYDNCELDSRTIRLVGDADYTECISLTCAQVGQVINIELQVVDIHGLQNTCTVAVSVFDKLPPVITSCAADVTISCDENANDLSLTGTAEATDNCNAAISFTDVSDLNECNVGEIIRTFIATDDSGNTSTCEQIITLEDNTQPIIQFSEDITLVCVDNNDELGIPTVEDNCGKYGFSFIDQFSINEECMQSFTRTWEVLNICTDERVSQSVKITLLNDSNLPQFSGAPTNITAECDAIAPAFITPIITDACDSNLDISISDTDEDGVCPSTRILTRTFTATDDCGNSNSFIQTITFVDNSAPTFINFPADQTINCDETILEGFPDVTDNCDTNPTVSVTNDTLAGTCLNEVIVLRTYTVSDFCGNSNAAIQSIRFVDDVAPIIRGQTRDLVVPCGTPIPLFDLGAIDNCDEDLDIIIDDTPTSGDCPQEENITRIFIVTDDCGNEVRDTIQIFIVDDVAPTVTATNFVENLTIPCNQELPIIDFTIEDNCDENVIIVESRDSTGTPCNLNIQRTFTASDDCGNATVLIQNVILIDDQPPFFASFPQDQDVTIFDGERVFVEVIDAIVIDECAESPAVNFVVDFFDNGDQPEEPNIVVEGNNASGIFPLGIHRVSFNTSDDCGNTINQDLIVSVVDFSPSAACANVTLEIGENGLLLVSPSAIFEDMEIINNPNISTIQFVNPSNFTEVLGEELLLTCDNIGLTQYAIEIVTNDGESSICSNMINLIDPDTRCAPQPSSRAAGVAGKIISLSGQPMTNVEISLLQDGIRSKHTDQFGVYLFDDLPLGAACEVKPLYDHDPAKGITTFDMVLIMQHILDIKPLANPYQHIAADVDLNGSIDIFDLLEIRSLILFQTEHFSVSPSHTFIEKKYEFTNPENPLAENIPAAHQCPALDENMIDLDFYMIKMGDIDGTLHENFKADIDLRNQENYDLLFTDKQIPANTESKIQIEVNSSEDIAALQFSLHLVDAAFVNYTTSAGLESNYFQNENDIHFAWTQYDGALPNNIITLTVKPNRTLRVSELLEIDQRHQSSSFTSEGVTKRVRLKAKTQETKVANNIILKQNTPNPFSDYTDIDFYLDMNENCTFSIHDMTGQVIYQQKDNFNLGWNSLRFTPEQIAPGVYIYSISQGQEKQIKKMVIAR